MLEIATADSEATHATKERCSRKAARKTHDSGVVAMTGVIEKGVEAGRYLFIESNAICSEDHVCRGEDLAGGGAVCLVQLCACFSGFPLIINDVFFRSSEPNLGFLLFDTPRTCHVPPRIQRESPLLRTNLPHCFYLSL